MTKRTKRFIASLMAGVMLVATAVPAFAETKTVGKDELSWTVSGEGFATETEIKITVPTDIDTIISPYGISIDKFDTEMQSTITGLGIDADSVSSTSIISPAYEVTNESAVPVNIAIADFKVKGSTSVNIATSSVAAKTNTPKTAYIYMQFANEAGQSYLGKTLKKPEKTANGKLKMVKSDDYDAYNTALKAKDKILEVKAKNASAIKAGKEGASLKPQFDIDPGKKGYIRIMGDVNANPIVSKKDKTLTQWNSSDSLTISYKLMFTPRPNY